MNLTREQEQMLLMKFDPFIRACVHDFARKGRPNAMDNREDFLQEARLAFLIHIRKIDDMSQLVMCRQRIKDAMYEFCRMMAPLYIPRKRYAKEKRKVFCIRQDIRDIESMLWCVSDEHVYGPTEVDDFVNRLSADEQTILRMKEDGCKNLEIMPVIHARNEPHMSRMLARLRQKVLNYISGI